MDFFQELKDLLATLESREIDYALCGGVALAIHGAPRATQDIDILVRPEDVDRLRQAARACGFKFESLPMDFASGVTIQHRRQPGRRLRAGFTKLIEGQPFMLDALLVSPSLEGVWTSRLKTSFEGGAVHVVSREGLISLKLAAGRPQDIADLQRLEEIGRG